MRITWDNIAWNYVNIDYRTDRRDHAEREFARHGITPRRQPGLLITRENCRPNKLTERMYNRTPGAIGCWLSQVEALKQTPANKIAAICEDDICFCDDLRARIEHLGEHLPHYWDVAWLGATFHSKPAKWHLDTLQRDADRISKRVFRAYGIWSTYGWLVNPNSKDKVCAMLDHYMPDSDGIDDCFVRFLEQQLWTYFMVPGCAWQYDGISNIGTGVSVFTGFRALGDYVWASKIDDFDPDTQDWGEAADYVYGPGRVEVLMPDKPLPANASLEQMGEYFDTDKGILHGYLGLYDTLFTPFRHKPINLLEIGVSAGGSLQMWLEYFTQAHIHSVDINKHSIPFNPRLDIQQCNQSDTARMKALYGSTLFDIIIDDGDHADLAQRTAFNTLWDRVRPGGIYIVEDIQNPEISMPYWESLGGTAYQCKANVSACVVLRKPYESNSQAGQDVFVTTLCPDPGFFIDLGCRDPIVINNTYLLEQNGWDGLLIDIDADCIAKCKQERSATAIVADALVVDFDKLLAEHNCPLQMDYLSLDVDNANATVLESFPFDKYRFRVLTIEHNLYEDDNIDFPLRNIQKQARDTMLKHGYTLVCANVMNAGKPFENWWVDAAAVPDIWKQLQCADCDWQTIVKKCKNLA